MVTIVAVTVVRYRRRRRTDCISKMTFAVSWRHVSMKISKKKKLEIFEYQTLYTLYTWASNKKSERIVQVVSGLIFFLL